MLSFVPRFIGLALFGTIHIVDVLSWWNQLLIALP
jgi:hypothetical protein